MSAKNHVAVGSVDMYIFCRCVRNGIYISYSSDFVKFNKQLNRKHECVKYFDIKRLVKTSSKNEAYLM